MKKLSLILLFLTALNNTYAQRSGSLDESILWKLRRLTEYKLSPDGTTLIYGVRSFDISKNKGYSITYLLHLDQPDKLVEVLDESIDAFSIKFRPDGKKIVFLSAKSGSSQLYEANTAGGDITQISEVPDGITGFHYSPDMKHILYFRKVRVEKSITELYPNLDKTTARIYDGLNYRHWDTWKDGTYSHLFLASLRLGMMEGNGIDLMQNEPFDVPNPPDGGEEVATWSPDSHSIVYSCKKLKGTAYMNSTNTDIYQFVLANGKTSNLSI